MNIRESLREASEEYFDCLEEVNDNYFKKALFPKLDALKFAIINLNRPREQWPPDITSRLKRYKPDHFAAHDQYCDKRDNLKENLRKNVINCLNTPNWTQRKVLKRLYYAARPEEDRSFTKSNGEIVWKEVKEWCDQSPKGKDNKDDFLKKIKEESQNYCVALKSFKHINVFLKITEIKQKIKNAEKLGGHTKKLYKQLNNFELSALNAHEDQVKSKRKLKKNIVRALRIGCSESEIKVECDTPNNDLAKKILEWGKKYKEGKYKDKYL